MKGNDARKLFIDYFKKHGHKEVRSASLVPADDPTLLFTNAGMVQFKRVFTGDEKRDYATAVTAQKCVRAGGKHNDLENVGYTARHHTFFEMLGNFSFGEYFKKEAIEYGWDLLTSGYGFDRDRLWVSVYLDDDEAFNLWKDHIGVPEERIVRLGEADNFWAMGDTGPCGPCSEIHIDRGPEFGCDRADCAVGCDCDRYLELWNLVFMQFDRDETGRMTPLPEPSIDTGLGLERISCVLQDVRTNYETDLFVPIMETVESLSGKKRDESHEVSVAMKVISDHARATAFLICDGVLPANEGRGYVLRRIMRRAIRYGRALGFDKPFMHHAVQTVFDIMADAYPELDESSAFILNVVRNEEEGFLQTLDNGIKLLEATIADLSAEKKTVLDGDIIFKLYDTYGFPVDIIADHTKEMDITLDMDGFNAAMARQKERSRSTVKFTGTCEAYKTLTSKGIRTVFTGHDGLECRADICLMVREGLEVETAGIGDEIELVTTRTPFYAESGGQAGDTGIIRTDHGTMEVTDTVADPSGLVIHRARVVKGTVSKGESASMCPDAEKRQDTARNHTATHILHAALRKVLGDHVKQAGSLVTPTRLRFDFTHFSPVDRDTLQSIENEVNRRIRENHPVNTREMSMEDARKSGATALFEEKYGDTVRVVSQGDFSRELCGGTHARQSGDIGLFSILSETGIASGVRRIEAVTGQAAVDHMHSLVSTLDDLSAMLKTDRSNIGRRVGQLVTDKKTLEKELTSVKAALATKSLDDIDNQIRIVNGVKVLSRRVEIENPSQMRDLADKFKAKIKSGIILLGASSNKKALLIAGVTDDLTDRYKAGDIVNAAAAIVGGGGGGRPDMAQAGGPRVENLDKALESVFTALS